MQTPCVSRFFVAPTHAGSRPSLSRWSLAAGAHAAWPSVSAPGRPATPKPRRGAEATHTGACPPQGAGAVSHRHREVRQSRRGAVKTDPVGHKGDRAVLFWVSCERDLAHVALAPTRMTDQDPCVVRKRVQYGAGRVCGNQTKNIGIVRKSCRRDQRACPALALPSA